MKPFVTSLYFLSKGLEIESKSEKNVIYKEITRAHPELPTTSPISVFCVRNCDQ